MDSSGARPRVILYSCLYGDTEPLNPDLFQTAGGAPAVLFTDQEALRPAGAEVVYLPGDGLTPDLASRRAKLMPERYLPASDWVVYCDNRCQLLVAPDALIDRIEALYGTDAPAGRYFFPHPWRDCVYDEAFAVAAQGPLALSTVDQTLSVLDRLGVPRHGGLTQNTMLVQKMGSDETDALNRLWFELFLAYVHRDQISLSLAMAALGARPRVLPFMMAEVAKWPTISRADRLAYQGKTRTRPSALYRWRLARRQKQIERNVPAAPAD